MNIATKQDVFMVHSTGAVYWNVWFEVFIEDCAYVVRKEDVRKERICHLEVADGRQVLKMTLHSRREDIDY